MTAKEEGVHCFPVSEHPAGQGAVEESVAKHSRNQTSSIPQDLKSTSHQGK